MSDADTADADGRAAMEAHGIVCVPKNVFCYKSFRYDRLADAVRYAEIEAGRDRSA